MESSMIVAIGTTNPTKVEALEAGLLKVFPSIKSITVLKSKVRRFLSANDASNIPSYVRDQPLSDEETMKGATNRAKGALEANPTAQFGVGIEGGAHKLGDQWFEGSWVAVVDRNGKIGIGCSAKFELSSVMMEPILAGEELADVIDRLSEQKDVRSGQGAMGIVTNGVLCRTECMTHGVIFAFAKFVSDSKYWEKN